MNIFSQTNKEDGIISEVFMRDDGQYVARLFDIDSNNYLPTLFVFKDLNTAKIKAMQLVGKLPTKPASITL